MRVSMIGTGPLVSLMDAGAAVRATIWAAYPMMWVDGTVCRGSVRSSCLDNPPAKGLPASVFDVIKANSGQLGDVVVLMSGYGDLVEQPELHAARPDAVPLGLRGGAERAAGRGQRAAGGHAEPPHRGPADPDVAGDNQRNKYIAINGA